MPGHETLARQGGQSGDDAVLHEAPPTGPTTTHEAMLASIARTGFLGINSPRIPLATSDQLQAGNRHVQAKVGSDTIRELLIIGPDAIRLGQGDIVRLHHKRTVELLGLMVLERSMTNRRRYFDMGFFNESKSLTSRGLAFSQATNELEDKVADEHGLSLITRKGRHAGSRIGIPDVVVSDLRHTNAYNQGRHQQMETLVTHYVLEGDHRPHISERGAVRGAQAALRRCWSNTLTSEQQTRFKLMSRVIADHLEIRTKSELAVDELAIPVDREKYVVDTFEPSWQSQAACRGPQAVLFFERLGERKHEKQEREARAKAICRTCSVQRECFDAGNANQELFGIWGGLSEKERLG